MDLDLIGIGHKELALEQGVIYQNTKLLGSQLEIALAHFECRFWILLLDAACSASLVFYRTESPSHAKLRPEPSREVAWLADSIPKMPNNAEQAASRNREPQSGQQKDLRLALS